MREGDAAAEPLLEPVPVFRRGLVVPEPADFEALVASQVTSEGLRDLRQAVAAWQAVAEKCDHAFEEVLKLSTYRLQVERALGARLAQEVKPGRVKKRSPEVTFDETGRLPDGVTKQQAAKYRQLAVVPDHVFDAYLQMSRDRRQLPTSAGARRFGVPPRAKVVRRVKVGAGEPASAEVPPVVVDIVERIMTPDVVVGPAVTKAKLHVPHTACDALALAKGDVFISMCPDPSSWLPRVAKLHRTAMVRQAVVLVVAEVWADWFHQAVVDGWSVCFLKCLGGFEQIDIALMHLGERLEAFSAAVQVTGASRAVLVRMQ